MAQRRVKSKTCDRCPGDKRATTTEQIRYQGAEYELDLCERHADMLQRDLIPWCRLGREIVAPSSGLVEGKEEWQRLHRVEQELGVEQPTPVPRVITVDDTPEDELPELLAAWSFTGSALESQLRQGFSDREIVEAAAAPESVEPHPGSDSLRVHRRGRLRVVVNAGQKVIVTVAHRDRATPKLDAEKRIRSGWTLSTHALERQELRDVSDEEILLAGSDPELVRSSKSNPHLRLHDRGEVTVVVDPEKRLVVTVFRRGAVDISYLMKEPVHS